MLTSRDKLLASLFAVQLAGAAVLGGVLINGLDDEPKSQTIASSGVGATAGSGSAVTDPGSDASASADPGTSADPGSAGTSSTTTTGGPGVAAGKSAAPGAGTTGGTAAAGASVIAAGAPIKIGSIVTESGAINFNSSAQGTKAYIDMVNQAGGVDGHKIQLIQDDDQLNSGTGDAEFKSLLAQGIYSFGAFSAPLTEGGIQSMLDADGGVPLVGSYGEYPEYHDKLAIAFSAYYSHYGYEMGAYLKKLGSTKPALIYVDNSNTDANNAIEAGFAAGFGAAPTYKDVVTPTATYQNDVLQMRSDGVDGLGSILDTASDARFLQAAGSYATQLKHVADPLWDSPSVKAISNADGTYVASDFAFPDSGDPAVQAYITQTQADIGSSATIDYFGLQGWLDGEIIVDALKSMHGVYPKNGLMAAVENLGTVDDGITMPLTFAPGARDINKCLQFGKLTSGKVVPTQGYTCDTYGF